MLYYSRNNFQLYHGDCLKTMPGMKSESVTTIFADPPYNLSNDGITCKSGRLAPVNKAEWDRTNGLDKDFEFTCKWLKSCKRLLKPEGTIWISGTMHNIYQIGFALQTLGFHILNEITWYKPNAPPNLSCRYFTHSHETIIWAKKSKQTKHKFNYNLMKEWDDKNGPSGKQMRSLWTIPLTPSSEKKHGNHPTQKPVELLKRIILSSSDEDDLVLDPFNGSGTTGIVANEMGRKYKGIDIDNNYLDITINRYENSNSC